jgi:hypothetical protein
MASAALEPVIPAGDGPQTYTLDNAATGFGKNGILKVKIAKLGTGSRSMDSII